MPLPRLHLFELNDSPWAPAALRDTVIETLSSTLERGRVLDGLVAPFSRFLEQSKATEVLDLCAGAGGPAALLVGALSKTRSEVPPFVLTDLQPQVPSWRRLEASFPDRIRFVESAVDATRIPPDLRGPRSGRVIINALHHFRPELAAAILRGACEESAGVFIAEGFERNPLGFVPFAWNGLPALLANPIRAPQRRLAKAALTYLSPIALLTSVWDGLVSTMRVYTEEELREMVAPIGPRFRWEYGTYTFSPFGKGTYFFGVPISSG